MSGAYRINSLSQLESVLSKTDWESRSGRAWGHGTKESAIETSLRKYMKELDIKPGAFEMPYWEGGFRTGKSLNVSQFLSGNERCMERRHTIPSGQALSGRRIVCQLALLAESNHETVMSRAVASMAIAARLSEMGENVEILFCWQSEAGSSGRVVSAPTVYMEASNLGVKALARIMEPMFFRTRIFAFRGSSGPNGSIGFGSGGEGSTVSDWYRFKSNCEAQQILRPGDICLDWTNSIEQQIADGMTIIGEDK